jgi:hypothetical protein
VVVVEVVVDVVVAAVVVVVVVGASVVVVVDVRVGAGFDDTSVPQALAAAATSTVVTASRRVTPTPA